jgi:hypothetical protein
MIHTWDRTFLDHHRHFIEGMERFLNSRGAPLPIWDPATPVPPEFAGVEATDFGQPRPPLQNLIPRLTIPRHLLPSEILGAPTPDALANAIRPWHDAVHRAIGGSMGDQNFSAAAPIFWAFHGQVDDMYAFWRSRHGLP